MTIITAIDYLKHPQLADEGDLREALETAIEALKKQMPKKKELDYESGMNMCPNCSQPFFYDEAPKYCYNCGQAIDFRESEEE